MKSSLGSGNDLTPTGNMPLSSVNGSEGECRVIPQIGEYQLGDFVIDTVYMVVIICTMTAALAVMWRAKVSQRILLDKFIVLEFIVTYALVTISYSSALRHWATSPQNVCQSNTSWRLLAWGQLELSVMRSTSIVVLTLVRFLSVVSPYFFERHLAFNNRSIYGSLLCFFGIGTISGCFYLIPSILDMQFYNGFCLASLRVEKNRAHTVIALVTAIVVLTAAFVINIMMWLYTRRMDRRMPTVTWDSTLAYSGSATVDSTLAHCGSGTVDSEEHELDALLSHDKVMLVPRGSESSGGMLHYSTNNPDTLNLGLSTAPAGMYQMPRGLSSSDSDIPSSQKSEFKRPMDDFQQIVLTPRRATRETHAPRKRSGRVRFADRCRSVDLGICQEKSRTCPIGNLSAITKMKFHLLQERLSSSPITKLVVTLSIIHLVFNVPLLVSISKY